MIDYSKNTIPRFEQTSGEKKKLSKSNSDNKYTSLQHGSLSAKSFTRKTTHPKKKIKLTLKNKKFLQSIGLSK